ncbi:MAG: hypothetical protein D6757_09240 [Alphaproteobacteria bacterium]|nr:MAG: hypothetical protein D6757_09240 [Alphaproteobacteria bacterium]
MPTRSKRTASAIVSPAPASLTEPYLRQAYRLALCLPRACPNTYRQRGHEKGKVRGKAPHDGRPAFGCRKHLTAQRCQAARVRMSGEDIISCPACGARFRLPPGRRPRPGMRMKCGACGHVWRWQEGEDAHEMANRQAGSSDLDEKPPEKRRVDLDLPPIAAQDEDEDDMPVPPRILGGDTASSGASDAPSPERATSSSSAGMQEDSAHLALTEAEDVLRRLRERNRRTARRNEEEGGKAGIAGRSRRVLLIAGWGAWVLFVGTLIVGLTRFPERAVRVFPPLARLYDALGAGMADVKPVKAGEQTAALTVVIDDPPEWRTRPQGGYDLVVAGRVVNHASSAARLPPLLVELVADDGGEVLRRQVVEPSVRMLPAGGEIVFETVIADAPTRPASIVARLVTGATSGAGADDEPDREQVGHGTHSRR